MVKADGSLSVHADDRAYKPLNWMSPPCRLVEGEAAAADGRAAGVWTCTNPGGEVLRVVLEEVHDDVRHHLGEDPGLVKDGVEAHLQELLAEHVADVLGEGHVLVRREYPTDVGPVDLLVRAPDGATVAVEVKRRGEIAGVEQLVRYVERLHLDPSLRPVRGVLAAQDVRPQAAVLAESRGLGTAVLDYDALRGARARAGVAVLSPTGHRRDVRLESPVEPEPVTEQTPRPVRSAALQPGLDPAGLRPPALRPGRRRASPAARLRARRRRRRRRLGGAGRFPHAPRAGAPHPTGPLAGRLRRGQRPDLRRRARRAALGRLPDPRVRPGWSR